MKKYVLLFIILITSLFVVIYCRHQEPAYILNQGNIYGTVYHIKYEHPAGKNLHPEIKREMSLLDTSLSTYIPESVISKINNNVPDVEPDEYFIRVFTKATEISEKTNGAFDMTVAPLVNAWGFGFTDATEVDSSLIDSLLEYVGYQKIRLEDKKIVKEHANIMLDGNAIAKGFSVDVVGKYLEKEDIKNYMVEIGGEVRARGKNKEGNYWRIGIDKPIDDPTVSNRELQGIVELRDKSLATSGNYRRFYIKDGRKYAHTIDPKTGYPIRHELLSASVFAGDCMTADAYATAFMVMGLKKSINIVSSDPELEAYFIYTDADGQNQVLYSEGVKDMLIQ
jgi:FAD:protein FMN transferase